MEPEKLMESLMQELTAAMKGMSKATTVEEKVQYSKLVRNLSESLGVFLSLANDMMEEDMEE